MIFYGIFRITAEQYREPDPQLGYLIGNFSMGTILSNLMIIAGLVIFVILKKKMKFNLNFFKKLKKLPVDVFFKTYCMIISLGITIQNILSVKEGDFLTSPKVSNLFSEMIAIWIISSWELFGKPKLFNIVELGPGDGDLTKILLKTFKKISRI